MVRDEKARVLLTSMVACLFAREVYKPALLGDCLNALGYRALAEDMEGVSARVQKLRWRLRLATGFDPVAVKVPERFTSVTNWKGKVDGNYMNDVKREYGKRILKMGSPDLSGEM